MHGTPTWSFEYRHLIRALSAQHRCIAPDHLGFGLSQRPPDFAYTPEAHARVLAELVERLGLERFTVARARHWFQDCASRYRTAPVQVTE